MTQGQPSPQSPSIPLDPLSVIPADVAIAAAISVSAAATLDPDNASATVSSSSPMTDSDPIPFTDHEFGMQLQPWLHRPGNLCRITCFSVCINVLLLIGSVTAVIFLFLLANEEDPLYAGVWTTYALFISMRSIINITIAVYRNQHPTFWINIHTESHPASRAQRLVYWIRVVLFVMSAVCVVVLFLFFLIVDFDVPAEASSITKLYLSMLLVEFCVFILPPVIFAHLMVMWSSRSLSCLVPFLPINYSALQHFARYHEDLQKNGQYGLSKQVLSHLPIEKYHEDLLPVEADRICPICLNDFNQKEKVRILYCKHVYHQACVDTWLKHKGTCPLCVRVVAPLPSDAASLSVVPGSSPDGSSVCIDVS